MRNSRTLLLCFTLAVAATITGPLAAQSISSRRGSTSVRHNERAARAAWTPSRPSANRTVDMPGEIGTEPLDAIPVVRAGSGNTSQTSSRSVRQGITNPVRMVDHLEAIPAGAIISSPVVPMPLDGQVIYEGGGSACDMLPGGCGCGDSVCGGGCGFEAACGVEAACCDGGCDSIGCDGGCSMCGELCSPNAWRPCVTLCLPQDGWFSAEYLYWWQDGMDLPPLVTTSTDNGVAQTDAGVLGRSTTRTLFGGNSVLDDGTDGLRLRFGVWLNKGHTWGVGAEYFNVGEETENFRASSGGAPILARPFNNILNGGVEESELVAFPGVVSGDVSVRARSELTGAGFHFRHLRDCCEGCGRGLLCSPNHYCSRSEFRLGYRYLDLDEGIRIEESLVSLGTAPGSFEIFDSFDTRNQFNGLDFGWMYRRTRGYWTFDSTIRIAVGNTHQTARIRGQTTTTDPSDTPATQTRTGGLLAQRTNIGDFDRDEFTVVPEFSFGIGYQLTKRLRATVGYNFIYWSNVLRPGDHIDDDVNPELLPPELDTLTGDLRPGFEFDNTDYWVQGISIGGEYRW